MFETCDCSNGLGRKQFRAIFVTDKSTCRQAKAALLVGYFLKIVLRVLHGRPLLTVSVNPSFSLPYI